MSGGEEHDSFDDDDDSPNENILPSTSNEKAPDGAFSRKRGNAVLTTSQSENKSDNDEDSFDRSTSFENTPKRTRVFKSPSLSPIKERSPEKLIDEVPIYDQNVDGFPSLADLPISTNSSRHQYLYVVSTEISDGTTTLHCKNADKNDENGEPCVVYIQGTWHSCEIREDSTIRLIGAKKWSDMEWLVNDEDGIVVSQVDTLISCSTVSNSLFCPRQAVLKERLGTGQWIDKAMLISKEMIKGDNVQEVHPDIIDWVRSCMPKKVGVNQKRTEGEAIIKEVHEIEGDILMPTLGLKGKIDVSFEVDATVPSQWLFPLELKKESASTDTSRTLKVLLYTMMLAHRYSLPIQEGYLLYLKDGTARRVQPRSAELKGIISLRNDIATFIGKGSSYDKLPIPRADPQFCKKCDYASACTLYGKAFERREEGKEASSPDSLPSDEAIAFQLQMTEHLTEKHLDYFRKWIRWLYMESTASMSDHWEMPARKRESLSTCTTMANLLPLQSGESRVEKNAVFHLDRHESDTVQKIQIKNVISLMSAEEKCTRLRSLLIDLEPPSMMKLEDEGARKVNGVLEGLKSIKQRGAVYKSLRASDYALIEGLPGSGKTSTLVALVRSIVALGHTVLVTAYTHSAVDNLLAKIAQVIDHSRLLRLDKNSSAHPSVQGLTLQAKLESLPEQEEEILTQTPVVATTSLAVTNEQLFSKRRFDFCIVDESSLVLESSLIGPLLSADRFVLVGDAKQLKPLVQSKEASDEGMSTSLFERLLVHSKSKNMYGHIETLDKQFRMNRVVSSVASTLFYDGRLVCANDEVAEACLNSVHEGYEEKNAERKEGLPSYMQISLDGSIENSALFIDVPSGNGGEKDKMDQWPTVSLSARGIVNEREIEVVKRLIEEFKARGLPTSSIGVAAVYRKQVDRLRELIPNGIEVNTVDQWQGRDAEILICSLAWTTAHGRKRSDLLSDGRRINVALTRAKYKMIFTGCVKSMRERCPLVSSVIDKVKVEKLH